MILADIWLQMDGKNIATQINLHPDFYQDIRNLMLEIETRENVNDRNKR